MHRVRFPHRYRLLRADGTDLGLLVAGQGRWRPGDTLHRGGEVLEVVRVVDAEPGERVGGYLIVADAAPATAPTAALA